MKYRLSFVTNSSSSCYVCDICGHNESGMDLGLSDAGMYECVNGHTFCEHHVDESKIDKRAILKVIIEEKIEKVKQSKYYTEEDKIKKINEYLEENTQIDEVDEDELEDMLYEYDFRYEMPSSACPICQFESLIDDDLALYFEKLNNITDQELKEKIKSEFQSYDEFKKYIKS